MSDGPLLRTVPPNLNDRAVANITGAPSRKTRCRSIVRKSGITAREKILAAVIVLSGVWLIVEGAAELLR
jgi:hypothetical protein